MRPARIQLSTPSRGTRAGALLIVALTIGACQTDDVVGLPNSGLHPAIIEVNDTPGRIDVPTVVASGTVFEVVIETYGGPGLANAPGHIEVARSGSTVTLRPFDDFTSRPVPSYLLRYEHRVELSLDEPGIHELRVVGRRDRGYQEVARTFAVTAR